VAQLKANYDLRTQSLDIALTTAKMELAALRRHAELAEVPMLTQMTSGSWGGELNYRQHPGEPAVWGGNVQLSDAELPFPAFSEPVRLDSAQAEIQGARVDVRNIRAHVGALTFQGEYAYDAAGVRAHHFRLTVAEASAEDIEDALLPVLRRQSNLIARALNLGRAPAPDWTREWRA